jgi:hypothetical protein
METTQTKTNGRSEPFDEYFRSLDPVRQALVTNLLMSRREWLTQTQGDPRRDIYHECGWPKDIGVEQYQKMYDRNPIGCRVVQVYPKESWQVQPVVYENEDPNVLTAFEKAWNGLSRQFRRSYRRQVDKGSSVWEYLLRADILSGIGQFGIILLGLSGSGGMDTPAYPLDMPDSDSGNPSLVFSIPSVDPGPSRGPDRPAPKVREQRRLLYLRVMPESLVSIERYETNERNPRYGLPVMYNVKMMDPDRVSGTGFSAVSDKRVHWTRVVHVADNLASSEYLGVPRQQTVYNPVMDVEKVLGGSAEMYWRGAFPGVSLETHPSLGGDVDIDVTAIKRMLENYMNGLQRYLNPVGMTAKSLAPQVVDPTPQIHRQIEAICILLGVPKRIFMGSERGELASSQDDAAWNDRLRERQRNYITPRIIEPFIDRLIDCGVLPAPEGFFEEESDPGPANISPAPDEFGNYAENVGYQVWWPDLTSQTVSEKAEVTFKLSQALAQYVTSKAYVLMSPIDYLIRVFGMEEQEAHAVWEARKADPEFAKAFEALNPPQQPGNDASKKGDDNGGAEAKRQKSSAGEP